MKESIQIPNAPEPIGPYSPAIRVGNQLFVSGQIPMNPITQVLVHDDITLATTQVMENVKALVIAAGFSLTDVVKCTLFLKDMNDFEKVNLAYGKYFPETPPARETIEISRLPMDAIVEISCIAVKA
jgi:2-iminobutanoate/2-iminopropanoate deaminase